MKTVLAMITLMLLMLPAYSDEPLKGGVDYTEKIPALQDESGIEQHGERTIEWNAWVSRLLVKSQQIANKKLANHFGQGTYCVFTIIVHRDGTIIYIPIQGDNRYFADLIGYIYTQLQGSKYVKFPEGSQRTEVTIANNRFNWVPRNMVNYNTTVSGYDEQQAY